MTAFATAMAALSPTAWWRMAVASGNITDSSGNSHTLTAVGSPTYQTTGWNTDDYAIDFNATSQCFGGVDLAPWASVGTSDFSLAWAMKTNGWPSGHCSPFGHDLGGGLATWGAYFQGTTPTDRLVLVLYDANFNLDFSSGLLTDNAWHYCVLAVDRSATAALYVDGNTTPAATVDVSSKSANSCTTDAYAWLGGDNGNGYGYWKGSLDEVAFWSSRLLTAQESADLYAARNGSDTPPPTIAWIRAR